MSKSDLKAAMDLLQVRKPLRLPARAPVFNPPVPPPAPQILVENTTPVVNSTGVSDATPVPKQTRVENETQVDNSTGVLNSTPVVDQTQDGASTSVENPTLNQEQTQVENQTRVLQSTVVGKVTQVENPTGVQSAVLSRRATEQDSSVAFEARAVDGLERGYTRIPNAVLMRMVSGDFTRNEMKLALLIARFTISYQRQRAPLSKAVLERRTGLRGPAVLEGLSGLLKKGLIDKEQGDQNRPNMLGLILPEGWDCSAKISSDAGAPTLVENPTPVKKSTPVVSPNTAEVGNPTGAGVGNPTYFKDKERYLNKNSLSPLPEKLREYFDELKPAKKKESEWQAFQALNAEYTAEDIAECFSIVQTRGVPVIRDGAETTERCHSPMAFLSKAIGETLQEVQERRAKAHERAQREQKEAQAQKQRADADARESAEWAMKEQAFQKAFPSEEQQLEALAELCKGLPFRPHTEVGRIFGIGKWWEEAQRV